MRVLIIEDEELAVKNLTAILEETEPDAIIAGICSSVRDAVIWLKEKTVDLILLDIHLSDGLSFKIFEQVIINTPVILTTAYDQFAIKAFELNSIDYLIKPIKVSDFKKAINKFKTLRQNSIPDYNKLIDILQNKEPEYRQRFSVNYGDKLKSIDVADIAAFYIWEKAVFITTLDGLSYDLSISLDQIEKEISPKMFFRINRQLIINHRAIENMFIMSNRSIKVDLKTKLPVDAIVSILRLNEFKTWLNK
ncbi:MAG: response regulator transcription factor [Bacteroidales bacterium]|nr:response regulator transcription factor [Bacteroidales bacterium]